MIDGTLDVPAYRHGRRVEYRRRPQLDRIAVRSGQLVCVRTTGVEPQASTREIAEEWVRMTYSNDARFVAPTVAMMMGSREAAVDYMTPLGLAHLMAAGHHYGPGPWQGGAACRLDAALLSSRGCGGIGADRGTAAATQFRNTPRRSPRVQRSSAHRKNTCCGFIT